jgi:molecular chaperone GrpE
MSEQEQFEMGPDGEEPQVAAPAMVPASSGEAAPVTEEDPAGGVTAEAKELTALQDRYLRLAAEFDNYRKRAMRERAELVRTAHEGLLVELLPVVDNLERALAAARSSAAVSERGNEALIEGVEITLRLFRSILEKQGVKEIESVGRQFDPTVHHAVEQVRTDAYPENTVVEEVLRGYFLDQRVLRPALVKVASAPPVPVEGDGGRG